MNLCRVGMVQTICRRTAKNTSSRADYHRRKPPRTCPQLPHDFEAFPDAKRVGVTATPIRLSGGGLGDVNDKLVIGVSTKWLIENEFLAPYEYYAPTVADLTGLHVQRGEFVTEEVVKALNTSAIYGDVISYYRKLSDESRLFAYCASIEHSKNMAEQFNAAGITAAHLDGETPKAERKTTVG